MKQFRTIAILAGLLLALGGLATWDEWQTEKDEEAQKVKNRLVRFTPEDVTEFEYFRAKGDGSDAEDSDGKEAAASDPIEEDISFKLQKQEDGWRIVSPVAAKADVSAVDNFLKTLSEYDVTKVVAESKDRFAEFGLESPRRTITVKFAGEKPGSFTLHVGDNAPVGYSVYSRLEGTDKVHLGSQYLAIATAKTLFDFRDKSLVSIDSSKVKEMGYFRKMPTGDVNLRIAREGETWKITKDGGKGVSLAADGPEVRDYLDEISALKAKAFHDQPGVELRTELSDPDWVVSWVDESGASRSLKVSRVEDKLYAAFDAEKLAFELPEDSGGKLDRDLMSFRDRRVLDFDSANLKGIKIDGDEFVNVRGSWFKPGDAAKLGEDGELKDGVEGEKPDEAMHVRSFLVDFEFAKTFAFIRPDDPAVSSLEGKPPAHRVILTFKEEAKRKPVTLDFHVVPDEKDFYFVTYEGADYVYKISESILQSMKPSPPTPDLDEDSGDVAGDLDNASSG